ncbi:MAG: glycoside hydrolase family 3 C-terminal domain-containing protein [Lewinellaceae bacterium]|nr:glycoside hydrolase family 3 C-terminal domain-containing protein [Lewinellaceae bacterium]
MLFSLQGSYAQTAKAAGKQAAIQDKVRALLEKMTPEEKVGQMTQVAIDLIMKDGGNQEIDEEKLRRAIVEKKVGSILNVKWTAYSLDKWHEIITRIQEVATRETPNKIPVLYGIDAIHGANYILEGTVFPHNIGMAASRNDELVEKAAHIAAIQTRASGIRWNFDPVLGVGRQPLWPRFEETFGEDPLLAGNMGSAAVRGYEGDGLGAPTAVASCIKHYLAYSVPNTGKDRTPAYFPEIMVRELLLPPFRQAAEAGSSSVMINSGELNGVPLHASHYWLTEVLRGELGFKGLAVSDWEDVIRLHTRHRVADSPKEAVRMAVMAGIDMSMVPNNYSFYDYLLELLKEGQVPMARIDEAAGRILTLKMELGLFDNPFPEVEAIARFENDSYAATALEAARESLTLLKNRAAVLPLPKDSKILLAGPGANNLGSLHGSWSFTWLGREERLYPESTLTIKEALEKKLNGGKLICRAVPDYHAYENYDALQLQEDARQADYIILCLGEEAYAESPGTITDLSLDPRQLNLAQAAILAGKPVILVLAEGRPRILSPVEPGMDAVLLAGRPGSRGAEAIADVLFGDYNPNGILPFSYPRRTGDFTLYDHKFTETVTEPHTGPNGNHGYDPQWPFGLGLSYTTFEYGDIRLSSTTLRPEGKITATIAVRNTGQRDGKVAVDLYTRDLYASITPPQQRLRAYRKVMVPAGKSVEVSFTITPGMLSFVNSGLKRVTEPGGFEVMIGDKKAGFTYEE